MAVGDARHEQARAGSWSWPWPARPASSCPRSSSRVPRRTWGRNGRTPRRRRTRGPRRSAPAPRSRRTPSAAGPRRSRIAWTDHGASPGGATVGSPAAVGVSDRLGCVALGGHEVAGVGHGQLVAPPWRGPRRAPRRPGRRARRSGWPRPARRRVDTPSARRRAACAAAWSGPRTSSRAHHGDHVGGHPDVEAHPSLGDRRAPRSRGTPAPRRAARPPTACRAGRHPPRASPDRRRSGAGARRPGHGGSGSPAPPRHGSSSRRSHSTSHTRRPMAASSTERTVAGGWVSACTMQMIPHRSVPSTCHQRRAAASTATPPASS